MSRQDEIIRELVVLFSKGAGRPLTAEEESALHDRYSKWIMEKPFPDKIWNETIVFQCKKFRDIDAHLAGKTRVDQWLDWHVGATASLERDGFEGCEDAAKADRAEDWEEIQLQQEVTVAPTPEPAGLRLVCRLLPSRLQVEDFGDTLEALAALERAGAPAWRGWLKVGCCALWLLSNAVREGCARLLQEGLARLFKEGGRR